MPQKQHNGVRVPQAYNALLPGQRPRLTQEISHFTTVSCGLPVNAFNIIATSLKQYLTVS